MKNSKGPETQPTINYVRGRIIDIIFEDRRVSTVTVTDKATGVLIEPAEAANATPARHARSGAAPASGNLPPARHATGHSTMTDGNHLPESVRALIGGSSQADRLDGFALDAIVRAADENGAARIRDVAANYRNDYLRSAQGEGCRRRARSREARPGRSSLISA